LADAFVSEARHLTLDLNVIMLLNKRVSLFANAQNVFNAQQITNASGPLTPHYASRRLTSTSGTTVTVGLKGSL
jgi:hypothetical protein